MRFFWICLVLSPRAAQVGASEGASTLPREPARILANVQVVAAGAGWEGVRAAPIRPPPALPVDVVSPAGPELKGLVEIAERSGEDRFINALLSETLGLGSERYPIKYLSSLDRMKEVGVGRAPGGSPADIVLVNKLKGGQEAFYYLTSPAGELRSAVHAVKGQGFSRVEDLGSVRRVFEAEKLFWLEAEPAPRALAR